jgi:hypothetical protein
VSRAQQPTQAPLRAIKGAKSTRSAGLLNCTNDEENERGTDVTCLLGRGRSGSLVHARELPGHAQARSIVAPSVSSGRPPAISSDRLRARETRAADEKLTAIFGIGCGTGK